MKKIRKSSAVVLSALLLSSSFYALPAQTADAAGPQSAVAANLKGKDQRILARFDANRAYEDVRYMSVDIGPRVAGTAAEKETADWIKNRLLSYGLDVQVQEFKIPDTMTGEIRLSSTQEVLTTIPVGSGATQEGGLQAKLVDAGFGRVTDFTEAVKGNIALISRGEGLTFAAKVQNAAAAGAAGVILYDNVESAAPLNPSLGFESSIPVAGVTRASGLALKADYAGTDKNVTLQVKRLSNAVSTNIIATRTPKHIKNPDIIHVSAHYDSVPFAPGASDNASGTSVLLELARILKSYPIDKEIRFVFVGAEEIGLLGSKYYVSQLSADEKNRSLGNFNMDMVGTSWENATAIFMNTVDGKANIVSETAKAAAKRIGTPSELILFERGASDHVSFHEAGIAAVNFIRREPGTAALEPYYHTPQDTLQYISKERLQEAGELVGVSVYSLAGK
ncbi:M20/M25/M40 family metallo-hydrolase [Bacillus lacus]|uniref:M20/M25/M40 family metallo-hydrolase n=1 Tax=Metabacillus lacus TaxID=1983721 RepID=A0A7X2IYB5_9BACI|nr:M20/M25/M40 family metallo-hydrolase [Metabacillus lacus]MRX72045.1 M20/M25/M40 family metallo-hydrolase [Metabacillus lacus]